MRPWLIAGALAVCGCEEETSQPFQFSNAGSTGVPVPQPPDLRTAKWTWTECGILAGLKASATHAQLALDGEALVVSYNDGSLLLHRVGQTGNALLSRAGETAQPRVSPDGRFAVDWAAGTLVLHDLADFRESREVALDASGCGTAFSLSADNSQLLFVGSPASCVFDVESGMQVARVESASSRVAFLGDRFVVEQPGFEFASYDATGALLTTASLDVPEGSRLVELTGDGLAVVELVDHRYVVFEAETATILAELEAAEQPTEPVFSPDGALMLIDERVVALSDGELLLTADPSLRRAGLVQLSLDGRRAAVVDGFENEKRAGLFDVETGAGVQAFGGHARPVLGLAVSPDGTALVSTSGEQTFGYDLNDDFAETTARWFADADVWVAASFSPDGSLIAISGDGRVLLDAQTGVRVFSPPPSDSTFPGCSNAYFAFSHDQRWLAGGGNEFAVDVFDAEERSLLTSLESRTCSAAAAFSPDDSLLATAGPELYRTSDWSRIWPETVGRQPDLGQFLSEVAFVPDEQTLSVATCILDGNTGGLSCTGKQYALDTGAEVEATWRDFTGARKYSPDGSWMLSGSQLQHRFSTQHRNLVQTLTATTFAPNGDIIGGDRAGRLFRFCKSELP